MKIKRLIILSTLSLSIAAPNLLANFDSQEFQNRVQQFANDSLDPILALSDSDRLAMSCEQVKLGNQDLPSAELAIFIDKKYRNTETGAKQTAKFYLIRSWEQGPRVARASLIAARGEALLDHPGALYDSTAGRTYAYPTRPWRKQGGLLVGGFLEDISQSSFSSRGIAKTSKLFGLQGFRIRPNSEETLIQVILDDYHQEKKIFMTFAGNCQFKGAWRTLSPRWDSFWRPLRNLVD